MTTRLCRDCSERIRFVLTPAGRRLPIDLDPHPGGNVVMVDGVAHVLTAAENLSAYPGRTRLMPHAATCTGRRRRRN